MSEIADDQGFDTHGARQPTHQGAHVLPGHGTAQEGDQKFQLQVQVQAPALAAALVSA